MNPLERMTQAAQNMHAARREHKSCLERAAKAKHAYRVAYAKALLKADGTVPVREAKAIEATADQLLEKEIAEGLAASALEAVRNCREEVGAWRTYVSATKDGVAVEWAMAEVS